MNIYHKIVIVLSFMIISIPASAQEPVVTQTVMPFFQALKQRDVKVIRTYIDEPLYSKIKVLLKENKAYPDYLRKWYSGASADFATILYREHKEIITTE